LEDAENTSYILDLFIYICIFQDKRRNKLVILPNPLVYICYCIIKENKSKNKRCNDTKKVEERKAWDGCAWVAWKIH
jgi:hypothetical protein